MIVIIVGNYENNTKVLTILTRYCEMLNIRQVNEMAVRPISILRFLIPEGLNSKGWNSKAHRGFPGMFEWANLSRDSLSMEKGPQYGCAKDGEPRRFLTDLAAVEAEP